MTTRPFSMHGDKYDQSQYLGRVKHFMSMSNPIGLFKTQEDLDNMRKLLRSFEEGKVPPGTTDADLYQARDLLKITYARDGEKIPIPFRLNGYGIFNLPITVGLMMPGAGMAAVVFWQWANQTQNALINHYNRSSVKPMDMDKTLLSYGAAVTGAVGASVGSIAALKRVGSPAFRAAAMRVVPFFSVATANVLNTFLMRRHEIVTGISVYDENNEVVGTSNIAAKTAVAQTCASRAAMSFCLLALPPWIYSAFEKTKFLKANPRFILPMQFGVVGTMIFLVFPMSVALFQEEVQVRADDLEPHIAKEHAGKTLHFSKGL